MVTCGIAILLRRAVRLAAGLLVNSVVPTCFNESLAGTLRQFAGLNARPLCPVSAPAITGWA
jgi:hypothetical protein